LAQVLRMPRIFEVDLPALLAGLQGPPAC